MIRTTVRERIGLGRDVPDATPAAGHARNGADWVAEHLEPMVPQFMERSEREEDSAKP